MRRASLLLLPALLACGETPSGPDAPVSSVKPQAITYSDIEANNLHGAGCAFASGTSIAPIVMAAGDEAVMKIDGEIRRFRLDSESEGARSGTEARYLAEDRVLLLTIEGESAPGGEETANLTGSVRLVDGAGAVLHTSAGTVQCGS